MSSSTSIKGQMNRAQSKELVTQVQTHSSLTGVLSFKTGNTYAVAGVTYEGVEQVFISQADFEGSVYFLADLPAQKEAQFRWSWGQHNLRQKAAEVEQEAQQVITFLRQQADRMEQTLAHYRAKQQELEQAGYVTPEQWVDLTGHTATKLGDALIDDLEGLTNAREVREIGRKQREVMRAQAEVRPFIPQA